MKAILFVVFLFGALGLLAVVAALRGLVREFSDDFTDILPLLSLTLGTALTLLLVLLASW